LPSTARTAASSFNPSMGIVAPLPIGARARAISPRSPALRRERRRVATAAASLCRSLGSPVVHCTRAPSQHPTSHIDPARPAPPRRRPRRRRERAGGWAAEWCPDGQGLIREKKTFFRDPSA
jgi:hypothetical protein